MCCWEATGTKKLTLWFRRKYWLETYTFVTVLNWFCIGISLLKQAQKTVFPVSKFWSKFLRIGSDREWRQNIFSPSTIFWFVKKWIMRRIIFFSCKSLNHFCFKNITRPHGWGLYVRISVLVVQMAKFRSVDDSSRLFLKLITCVIYDWSL